MNTKAGRGKVKCVCSRFSVESSSQGGLKKPGKEWRWEQVVKQCEKHEGDKQETPAPETQPGSSVTFQQRRSERIRQRPGPETARGQEGFHRLIKKSVCAEFMSCWFRSFNGGKGTTIKCITCRTWQASLSMILGHFDESVMSQEHLRRISLHKRPQISLTDLKMCDEATSPERVSLTRRLRIRGINLYVWGIN